MNQREVATLRVEKREGRGKGAARKLRASGRIPANIYGHGVDSISVAADAHEFEALANRISVDNTLVELELGEKSRRVLIREIQRHPYKSEVLHIDFFAIREDETIRVSVPVHLSGIPVGVRNSGGVLQQALHEVTIEVLPSEIPEAFEIDATELEIGDSLHVAELDTMGFETAEATERTIVTVQPPRIIEEEEEEEEELEGLEGLEPEVISAREGEEEEAEEAEEEAEDEES